MKITYEAKSNVHIPSLKCTYPIGTRFIEEDGIVSVNIQKFKISNEFNVLVRHGFLKMLLEEEANTPEVVQKPKTVKVEERSKMKVVIQEDLSVSLAKNESEDVRVIEESNDVKEGKTVRGLKIVSENSSPLNKGNDEEVKTAKKEISLEKEAQIEATKKARLEALAKGRAIAQEKAAKAREAKEKEIAGQEKK